MCCENEIRNDTELSNLTPETQTTQNKHKKVSKKLLVAIAVVLVLAVAAAIAILLLLKTPGVSEEPNAPTDKHTIYVLVRETQYNASGDKTAYYVYEYDEFGNCLSGKYDQEMVEVTSDSGIYYYTYEFDGEFREFYNAEYTQDSFSTTRLYAYDEGYSANCQYDKYGRITEFTLSAKPSLEEDDDDTGEPVTYYCEYDKNGRLIRVYRPDENYGEYTTQLYEYDQDGRLVAASFCSDRRYVGRIEMFYDNGCLSKCEYYDCSIDQFQTDNDPEYVQSNVTHFQYDEQGNLIEITYTDEGEIEDLSEWVYDENSHLKEYRSYLGDGSAYITKFTCDENGNIIAKENFDGLSKIRTVYEYEEREVTAQQALKYDRVFGHDYSIFFFAGAGHDFDIVEAFVPNPVQEYKNSEDSPYLYSQNTIKP